MTALVYGAGFATRRIIRKAVKTVLSHFGISPKSVEVEIGFLSDLEMQELNLSARGVDRLTDVLSFPAEQIKLPLVVSEYDTVNPQTGALQLGEIYVSMSKAREQAEEYGHGLTREIAFLTVHGMLHLLGFDHIESADEKVMKAHADEILNDAGFQRK